MIKKKTLKPINITTTMSINLPKRRYNTYPKHEKKQLFDNTGKAEQKNRQEQLSKVQCEPKSTKHKVMTLHSKLEKAQNIISNKEDEIVSKTKKIEQSDEIIQKVKNYLEEFKKEAKRK